MLPAAPGGWLYPAKLSAALPKYRELLRTRSTSNSGGMDESSRCVRPLCRPLHSPALHWPCSGGPVRSRHC